MPPRISSSTRLARSTLRSVWRSISSPIFSTTAGSSSTALVTVTSIRLFSCFQSRSNWRRMRNISVIRCFSIISSRKLRSSASAPETARSSPSTFSAVEKYGLKKKTCRSRLPSTASANCPSWSPIASSFPFSRATSKRASAYTRSASGMALLVLRSREGGEVDLAEGLLDEPLLVLGVEALAGHLLRRQHGQIGDLLADLLQRAPRLGLDVALGLGDEVLALLLAGGGRLGFRGLRRLPRAGHDVVGLLACLREPLAVLLEQLVGLLALPFGGLDRLRDRFRPLVERLLDFREGELAQHPHREQEEDQRPDHQAETRRDQEAAFALLRGERCGAYQAGECHLLRKGRRRSGRR